MFPLSLGVICLSASFMSVQCTIHWDCLGANVEKCEAIFTDAIATAYSEDPVNFENICKALEELIDCDQIDCGGEAWDPTSDYLTKLNEYMEATGLCGGSAESNLSLRQSAPCAVELSKNCTLDLANQMQIVSDPCIYYGVYADCIIKNGPECSDQTTADYVLEMNRQVREKMPTVFGSIIVDMCPKWPDS